MSHGYKGAHYSPKSTASKGRMVALIAVVVVIVLAGSGIGAFAHMRSKAELLNDAAAPLEGALVDNKLDEAPEPEPIVLPDSGELYIAQSQRGRCTLASVVMMMRRALYLQGADNWRDVTEDSILDVAWNAAGLIDEFTAFGLTIGPGYLSDDTSQHAAELIALLAAHPEGIVAYDPDVPHAVVLTDYDAATDTFYCTDPAGAYSGRRIPVSSSWNGERHGGSQAAVIAGFHKYWVIVG